MSDLQAGAGEGKSSDHDDMTRAEVSRACTKALVPQKHLGHPGMKSYLGKRFEVFSEKVWGFHPNLCCSTMQAGAGEAKSLDYDDMIKQKEAGEEGFCLSLPQCQDFAIRKSPCTLQTKGKQTL